MHYSKCQSPAQHGGGRGISLSSGVISGFPESLAYGIFTSLLKANMEVLKKNYDDLKNIVCASEKENE
ncbi:hypothetical protein E2C01_067546 [Portunus trituberculatus]|uniref:Uncharacterized protein n=1 Tax=Portunus trituberculatus TaxID=210409 RepID=A0A5B7HXQ2_PORTR|nr:hypothetical protein [Portunus trituberculatus]